MPYKAACCREVDPQPRTSETELARLDGGHCSRCRLQEAAHIKQAAAEAACSAAEAGHSPRVQRLQHAPAFLITIKSILETKTKWNKNAQKLEIRKRHKILQYRQKGKVRSVSVSNIIRRPSPPWPTVPLQPEMAVEARGELLT